MDGKSLRDLYLLFSQLKEEPRAGWVLRDVQGRTESVADHSWLVAMIELPPDAKLKALEMALTHDLAEIVTGDLTPADGVPKRHKHAREELTMRYYKAVAPGKLTDMLEARLSEYNRRDTMETKVVHCADKIEAAIQAQRYYMTNHTKTALDDFRDDLEHLSLDNGDLALTALLGALLRQWGTEKWPFKFVLLIGGPGSGKGTVCKSLQEHDDTVDSISLGEQLRLEVQDTQSPYQDFIMESFSKGIAVPATLAMEIFKKKLANCAQEGKTTIILDGFPRSAKQLQAFETEVSDQYATIYLECGPELLAHRLRMRAESSGRADDEDETIRLKRANDYEKDVLGIMTLLKRQPFHKVDASRAPDAVVMEVKQILEL